MLNDTPIIALRRLALLFGVLLLAFLGLFGAHTWRSVKSDQIRELQTVLALAERTLSGHLEQSETDLHLLAAQIVDGAGLHDLPRAQWLLQRYKDGHPGVNSVNLIGLDGQILANSGRVQTEGLPSLPSLAGEPAFTEFANSIGPATRTELSRPLFGPISKRWVFGLRYVMRDVEGQPVAVLSRVIPVDALKQLWSDAPVLGRAWIGLMRDDGFLISRHPVPDSIDQAEMYGRPRSGALRQHLLAAGFPQQGYVEGPARTDGPDLANVYRRLQGYPVTLFVAEPVAEFRAAWWARVRVPVVLVGLALLGAAVAYRYTLGRQQAWDAERSRAEAALIGSEREQHFLIEHLMAGVVVHGPDGAVRRCNPQACELLGLSEDQMMGRALIDSDWHFRRDDGSVMPPDEYLVSRVLATRAAVTGLVMGAVHAGRSEPVWLLTRADPEFEDDGQLRQIVATFVDISERRKAERMRERTERRYRMLYEHSLDGVMQGSPDGRIFSANPAACALLGRSEAEICAVGRAGIVDTTDPRLAELQTLRDVEGHAQGTLTMVRGDGTQIDVEISSALYTDDTGELVSSVVVRDVTDRLRAAQALAAQQVAERANRAKSEFVARMSHELRTPLNAILGFTEVMTLDDRLPLSPVQRDHVNHVREAGAHLLALINDLLDLSRVEAGLMKLNMAPFSTQALVRETIQELQGQARERDVTLAVELPDAPLPWLHGDRTRVRQVLLNLLSNAVKYNRPGGQAVLRLAREGRQLAFEVRDTGLGMSQAQVEKLFEPFNRLGRESSKVEGHRHRPRHQP